jgi:hypothetical protein
VIESALRRPGRFDRELEIAIPDEDGRLEILKIKTKDMNVDKEVDLFQIARDTHGYVGADLQQLAMESALQCIRSNIGNMDVDSEEPVPEEILDTLVVKSEHFMHGLTVCNPSTLRENKVEVSEQHGSTPLLKTYSCPIVFAEICFPLLPLQLRRYQIRSGLILVDWKIQSVNSRRWFGILLSIVVFLKSLECKPHVVSFSMVHPAVEKLLWQRLLPTNAVLTLSPSRVQNC